VTLDVCKSGCSFTANLTYNCNDGINPNVSGFGIYTYKWSNGSTSEILKIAEDSIPTTYCVTITETNTNCVKTFCKEIQGIKIDRTTSPCSTELKINVSGGQPPYSYLWNDGTTEPIIKNTVTLVTKYKVTVTDANGCTAVNNSLFVSPPIEFNPIPASCIDEFFSFDANNILGGAIYPNSSLGPYQFMSPIKLDKFKSGFNFKIIVYTQGCEKDFEIKLPQIESLDAQAINPSCIGCSDGYVVPVLGNTCYECTIGNVIILDENKNDVTLKNNNKQLKTGKYFIVVKDKNTGCYIGIKQIGI
jgi:hypothetical protein